MGRKTLIQPLLDAGRLVALSENEAPSPFGYDLILSAGRTVPARAFAPSASGWRRNAPNRILPGCTCQSLTVEGRGKAKPPPGDVSERRLLLRVGFCFSGRVSFNCPISSRRKSPSRGLSSAIHGSGRHSSIALIPRRAVSRPAPMPCAARADSRAARSCDIQSMPPRAPVRWRQRKRY
ncbi:LysR family transcriptional regulator [Klebsiella pneumoniae]|nr:LysR family transcriptional regulator [Klebsiella pneumoniae]